MDPKTLSDVQHHIAQLVRLYEEQHTGEYRLVERCRNAEFCMLFGNLYILGSNDSEDWGENFEGVYTPAVEIMRAKAHSGFVKHANTVLEGLGGRAPDIKRVIGHSLGGAAAQVIGAMMGLPVVTFGSPRVWRHGSVPVTSGFHHIRVWDRRDIIVGVPTRLRWQHYEHERLVFGGNWFVAFLRRLFTRTPQITHHLETSYALEINRLVGDG